MDCEHRLAVSDSIATMGDEGDEDFPRQVVHLQESSDHGWSGFAPDGEGLVFPLVAALPFLRLQQMHHVPCPSLSHRCPIHPRDHRPTRPTLKGRGWDVIRQ